MNMRNVVTFLVSIFHTTQFSQTREFSMEIILRFDPELIAICYKNI